MAMDDVFKSMQMFQDGMQSLAISNGINSATQQVNQINSMQLDEMDKREQHEQVARQLAAQLVGAGANAAQVQQASSALAPKVLSTPDQMYAEGVRTGSQRMQGVAAQTQAFSAQPEMTKQSEQQDFVKGENAKNRASAEKIAGLRADGKSAPRQLPANQVSKITEMDMALDSMDSLLNKFETTPGLKKEIGPVSGIDIIKSWTNPEFGDFKAQVGRDFDLYRKAITGAGAGAEEIKMLMANRPTVKDTPTLFLKKINTIKQLASQVRTRHLTNLGKAKFDVEGFMDRSIADQATAPKDSPQAPAAIGNLPPGIPAGSMLTPVRNKMTGMVEQVWRAPDGNVYANEQ